MLILTRRVGETITIGEKGEITIKLLGISGNQARLGIDAPGNIPVHRQEIFQKIQEEKGEERNGNE